jgi:ribosomal protein S2
VNNKGKKSLALTFMLLAREILLARKKIKQREKFKPTLEDFQESK